MKLGSSSILGLAIDDRGIACAQVQPGRRVVQRLAFFPITGETSLNKPEELGAKLKAFLRHHEISATRAVVGVPAKWLIAQEKEIPPADEAQGLAVLRLHAERLSAGDEMVFDATGEIASSAPTRVLLLGMMRQQVDRLTRLCEAAGVHPAKMTSTAVALTGLLAGKNNKPLVLMSRQGVEVVWQSGGTPLMVRHVAATEAIGGETAVAALAGELRRAFALAPSGGASGGVLLWDDLGLSRDHVKDLSERLGVEVRAEHTLEAVHAQLRPDALNGETGQMKSESFLPAIALAIGGTGRGAPVNFLRPRLAAPRTARFGRTTLLAAAIGILLAVGLAAMFIIAGQRERDADLLDERLALMQPDIKAAEERLTRFQYGSGYFDANRPPVLDCLLEVTRAFGAGEPIWATGFSLRETRKGQLQGKATDQRTVLAVLDRLKMNAKFANVQLQDMRDAGGTTREIAFSISFVYTGAE